MKKTLLFLYSLLFLLPLSSIAQDGRNTVYDVIANSPDHTLLETVLGLAGLPETLQGDRDLTVFAPTDAAVNALPSGVLEDLIADPLGGLRDLLLYHVIEGTVLAADLVDGTFVRTLAGEEVFVAIDPDGVFINNAKITVADIMATNGVVHVINVVIMPAGPPPPKGTVVEVIQGSPNHTVLGGLIVTAGLEDDLSSIGPFTVFAPTDAAINALPSEVVNALLADPTGQLAQVLLYHIVSGIYPAGPLGTLSSLMTLQGEDITIKRNEQGVFINDAKIIVTNLLADNGIIHVLDAVILPSETRDLQSMPLMFESSAIDYQLLGFGAPDGPIPAVIIDNPDASGENASGKVLSITKSEGAQTWAGVAMPVEGGFDFSGSTMINVSVWSPRAGVPFLLKIEDTNSAPDANGNLSVIAEVQVSTTVANAWEVLSFDMSQFGAFDATNGYNQVVVFPDFGNPGTGETFYVDGIRNTNLTATVDIIQLNAFKVSPNPFQQSTSITWENPTNQSYQVRLLNVSGQTLRAFQDVTGSTFTLNRGDLQSGLYFLNFQDEQGGTGTLKVLVK